MNPARAVCNYALLRFMPFPQTGEMVNVGVVVSCLRPSFLDFKVEGRMPDRLKGLFPDYAPAAFDAVAKAIEGELERVCARIRNPEDCRFAFNELVRPRENTFRFGEVRTAITDDPQNLTEKLFRDYVRMETRLTKGF